jgi:hypothetical protein
MANNDFSAVDTQAQDDVFTFTVERPDFPIIPVVTDISTPAESSAPQDSITPTEQQPAIPNPPPDVAPEEHPATDGYIGSFHWDTAPSGDQVLELSDSVTLDAGGAPIMEALDSFGWNRLYDWDTYATPGTWYYGPEDQSFHFEPMDTGLDDHTGTL